MRFQKMKRGQNEKAKALVKERSKETQEVSKKGTEDRNKNNKQTLKLW